MMFSQVITHTSCNTPDPATSQRDSLALTDSVATPSKPDRAKSLAEPAPAVDTTFINYITGFPSEIDGCSVIYSTDEQHFDQRRLIYMNNYDSVSFMKIEGVLIRFTLTSSESPDSETRVLHFSGGDYELIVEEKDGGRTGDEVWANYGQLTLTDRAGKTTIIHFVGESGC